MKIQQGNWERQKIDLQELWQISKVEEPSNILLGGKYSRRRQLLFVRETRFHQLVLRWSIQCTCEPFHHYDWHQSFFELAFVKIMHASLSYSINTRKKGLKFKKKLLKIATQGLPDSSLPDISLRIVHSPDTWFLRVFLK